MPAGHRTFRLDKDTCWLRPTFVGLGGAFEAEHQIDLLDASVHVSGPVIDSWIPLAVRPGTGRTTHLGDPRPRDFGRRPGFYRQVHALAAVEPGPLVVSGHLLTDRRIHVVLASLRLLSSEVVAVQASLVAPNTDVPRRGKRRYALGFHAYLAA